MFLQRIELSISATFADTTGAKAPRILRAPLSALGPDRVELWSIITRAGVPSDATVKIPPNLQIIKE
jgi:hypothetical protein